MWFSTQHSFDKTDPLRLKFYNESLKLRLITVARQQVKFLFVLYHKPSALDNLYVDRALSIFYGSFSLMHR